MSLRVRFAPSPTGYLHIGGARTALYNYLLARKFQGKFILRIEDTDRERSTQEAIRSILEGLEWLGLKWDEGPYYQSQHEETHVAWGMKLLEEEKAYRCFATPEELEAQRKEQVSWRYDPRYRYLSSDESKKLAEGGKPFVIRFRTPDEGVITFEDKVYGLQKRACKDIEDFALVRPDGSPLYNLSVVVDDAEMGITHVIRGQDHLSNTFKQILLYQAMGYAIPTFAHLPLILASDHAKLSKRRHGEAVSVLTYRDKGFLPQALVNFLALLGWNPKTDEEFFTLEELIQRFTLENINRANAIFNITPDTWTDKKLIWMNGVYLSRLSIEELLPHVEAFLKKYDLWDPDYKKEKKGWFSRCVDLLRTRYHTLEDFPTLGRAYFSDDFPINEEAFAKRVKKVESLLKVHLAPLKEKLVSLTSWDKESIEKVLRDYAQTQEIKAGILINALRVITTGQGVGPGIFDVLEVLGKERVTQRMDGYLRTL